MYDADGSRKAVITDSGDATHYIAGIQCLGWVRGGDPYSKNKFEIRAENAIREKARQAPW